MDAHINIQLQIMHYINNIVRCLKNTSARLECDDALSGASWVMTIFVPSCRYTNINLMDDCTREMYVPTFQVQQ